nr:MAG TPA: hypothetical protein [Caudoviricetes sp.]
MFPPINITKAKAISKKTDRQDMLTKNITIFSIAYLR